MPWSRGGIFLTFLQGSSPYIHYLNKESEAQTFLKLPTFRGRYRTGSWGFCTSKLVFFPTLHCKAKGSSCCLNLDAATSASLPLGPVSLQSSCRGFSHRIMAAGYLAVPFLDPKLTECRHGSPQRPTQPMAQSHTISIICWMDV